MLRLDAGRLVDDGPTDDVISRVGGTGWASTMMPVDGDVELTGLRVEPEVVGWGQPFEVVATVNVIRPKVGAHLEFAIRETMDAGERTRPRTSEEVMASTLGVQRLPALDPALSTIGRHQVRGRIEGVPVVNPHDVVISLVDELDGTILAELWTTVAFGRRGDSHAQFPVRWESIDTLRPGQGRVLGGEQPIL